MEKNTLFNDLVTNLERNYKVNKLIYGGRKTPLFELMKGDKKIYFVIFEAGTKRDVKDSTLIWHRVNKEILEKIDFNNTFFIIIDFNELKPRFILGKLNETNYNSHGNDCSFHFYRNDYGRFFNTNNFSELLEKIKRLIIEEGKK
ncbi:MAG: hypothetical protein NTU63_00780 [Candidatus Pacearchaeota archaeon]|nr:hypothetical protein [Candidatus Pacearchaeota archaeon]